MSPSGGIGEVGRATALRTAVAASGLTARSGGARIKAPRVGRASDPPDGGASLTFFARSAGRAEPDKRPALPSRGSRGRVRVEAQPRGNARGDQARLSRIEGETRVGDAACYDAA